MIETKVRDLLREQHKTMKELCEYIEMSDVAVRNIFKRDSCELKTLHSIARFFGVSPIDLIAEDEPDSVTAEDNSIAIGGNQNNVNSFRAIQEMLAEVSAQRKMTEKALEQVDRLVGVIESITRQNNS